jgi:hypothetical protein
VSVFLIEAILTHHEFFGITFGRVVNIFVSFFSPPQNLQLGYSTPNFSDAFVIARNFQSQVMFDDVFNLSPKLKS